MDVITSKKARQLALASQQVQKKEPFGRGKRAIVKCIRHLGYVQIDTISVIQRAHHHVLWNRIENYRPQLLQQLTRQHMTIFEYWSHALSYLPIENYRFTLPIKAYFKKQKDPWPKVDPKIKNQVYERVVAEGPLMARDFENPKSIKGSWFDWKPAKRSLERLFMEGELVVSHRVGFQKVYDTPERVIPSDIDQTAPSPEEYAQHLIDQCLQAHGIATAEEISYLRKGIKKQVLAQLEVNKRSGRIRPVRVRGIPNKIYYTTDVRLNNTFRIAKKVKVLSPFDNLVIQRKRLNQLFGMDYFIECYVPPPKRIYGYFCLPILYGDRFIGLIDAKADRKNKTMIIQSLHIEPFCKVHQFPEQDFQTELQRFARFNDCHRIQDQWGQITELQ